MSRSVVVLSLSCVLVGLLGGCDRSQPSAEDGAPAAASEQPTSEPAKPEQPSPQVEPQPVDDKAVDQPEPEPAAPQPEPPPSEPPTFEASVARLIGDGKPDASAVDSAWAHYKAKRYVDAQRSFALASLHDRQAWKHPFNLACASALAEDEAMVRVALAEAIARDQAAAAKKARVDGDLAAYRDAAWFEPILRGEAPTPAPAIEPPPEPPSDQPGEPAEPPEQAADRPETPPGPKLPPGQALPKGVAKPLAKARVEEIRDHLKKIHGLRPVVRGSLELTGPQGEALAFVVYDYTRFDECALTKSKNACRRELGAGIGNGDYEDEPDSHVDEMKCTRQFLARVQLGETPTIATPVELKIGCVGNKVNRFDMLDLDGDGAQEIVLDISGRIELDSYRQGVLLDVGRFIQILRPDASVQFALQFGWQADEFAPGGADSRRLRVRDMNDDGRLDLLIEGISFVAWSGGEFDADFWPSGDGEEELEASPAPTKVMLYDIGKDAWIE